jgi:Ser/Thr protein kinase RdoA (MazF antagonist)
VAAAFAPAIGAVERFGGGHINDTFLVATAGGELVIQRINTAVFSDPGAVTANIAVLHRHLAGRGLMPEPVPAGDGRWLLREPSGPWRAWRKVPGAAPVPGPTPATAQAAGRLLGRFHRAVAGLDAAALVETLPGFHDPARRLAALRAVVADDPCGRAEGVAEEIGFAEAGEPLAALAADLAARVPRRVCHYDAKLDNVLFRGDEAICLVDLDTVMPGAWFWDVGDLLRSAATTAAEDEPDVGRVVVDSELHGAVLAGYAAGLGPDTATPAEDDALQSAGAIVTYEQAVRFLTDWIAGDAYYRTTRPGQNLDRARAQFRLLMSMPGWPAARAGRKGTRG